MNYDENGKLVLTDEEKELFRKAIELQKQIYDNAKNRTNYIIRNNIKDKPTIEHTLDMLLDFLDDDEALLLYRKLCRHYWFIDQQATHDYIQMYADIYDPEHKKFGNTQNEDKQKEAKKTHNDDNELER